MKEFKPPALVDLEQRVFLAGSIEQGAAKRWQDQVVGALSDLDNILVFNPRRDSWDASWEQSRDNAQFVQQVQWELTWMQGADVILMYFDPATKSPITLLELGLYADSGKLIVVCPHGYHRQGNVDVTCDWYDVPVFRSLKDGVDRLRLALMSGE